MYIDPKFLINYPSRQRPIKFFAGLENIITNMQSCNYAILVKIDENDDMMHNCSVMEDLYNYEKVVIDIIYDYSNKISAINRSVDFFKWDILINFSDDIRFIEGAFDETIKTDANKYFPDGDFLLHYPETYSRERQCTVSIIDRKYYDRFGYVYNPEYTSVYSDTEALEVAKKLKRHKFIDHQIFEHYHPATGKGEMDDLYRRNEDPVLYKKDSDTFFKRQAENFGL